MTFGSPCNGSIGECENYTECLVDGDVDDDVVAPCLVDDRELVDCVDDGRVDPSGVRAGGGYHCADGGRAVAGRIDGG